MAYTGQAHDRRNTPYGYSGWRLWYLVLLKKLEESEFLPNHAMDIRSQLQRAFWGAIFGGKRSETSR